MEANSRQYEQYEQYKKHKKGTSSQGNARRDVPLMISWGILAVVAIVAATNVAAWHAALGTYLQVKFGSAITLGGLLTHSIFDLFFRVFLFALIVYAAFVREKRKNFFEWVGVGLLGIGVVAGSAALTEQGSWALAFVVWYLVQQIQYEGIFETSSGTVRLFACLTYLLEFAVQCVHTPVTQLPVLVLLERFSYGTLEAGDISWWWVLVNIGCMAGVEWLLRLKNQMEGVK